ALPVRGSGRSGPQRYERLSIEARDKPGRLSAQREYIGAERYGRARVGRPGPCCRSGLADGLALDLDLDLLADHDTAGLQRHVPRDAERLAVDLGGGTEAEHVVP